MQTFHCQPEKVGYPIARFSGVLWSLQHSSTVWTAFKRQIHIIYTMVYKLLDHEVGAETHIFL